MPINLCENKKTKIFRYIVKIRPYATDIWSKYGAGNGNRTRIASLEGWNSTIELHLHFLTTLFILQYYLINVNRNFKKKLK